MTLAGVTVAHVGHSDPGYARNRIVTKALARAGAEVVTIADQRGFVARTPGLVRRLRSQRPDVVFVGFHGHADVATVRMTVALRRLTRGRRPAIVFDPLVSLYEMMIEDRRTVAEGTMQAWRYRAEDRVACALADALLVDTAAHGRYFAARFGVPGRKMHRLWVGADDDVMSPREVARPEEFRVLFYGSFIPLHGVEHIVRAAHLLERSRRDVRFTIVGGGQTHAQMRSLAEELRTSSIDWSPRVNYDELPALLAGHDVALGIFGTTGKAQRVIPNKVFDALAVARPVVTADTPAAREALRHRETAWLCPAGDADALAEAIAALQADDELRERIAVAGHELHKAKFSLDAQASALESLVQSLMR